MKKRHVPWSTVVNNNEPIRGGKTDLLVLLHVFNLLYYHGFFVREEYVCLVWWYSMSWWERLWYWSLSLVLCVLFFLVWRFYELLRNNEMAYGSQQESPRGCSSMVWGSLGGIPSNSSSSRPSVSPSFISHTLLYKTIRTETVSLSLIFSGSPSFRLPTVFRHHGQYQGMQQSRGIQELSTLL